MNHFGSNKSFALAIRLFKPLVLRSQPPAGSGFFQLEMLSGKFF